MFWPALNSSMRRRPVENRVQNSRSIFSNPRLCYSKPRRLGGATERHKLKKFVKNHQKLVKNHQKCKQQSAKLNKIEEHSAELNKIRDRLKSTSEENEQQSAFIEENDGVSNKMVESARMLKGFSEKMFPSKGLKFFRGCSKAVDSPVYSPWYAGCLPFDDNHISQARKIDFAGSARNLCNQELPTYSNATNATLCNGGFDKARLNSELNLNSSGLPIFAFSGKSPTFGFSSSQSEHDSDKNLPSCMSSTKHNRNKKCKNLLHSITHRLINSDGATDVFEVTKLSVAYKVFISKSFLIILHLHERMNDYGGVLYFETQRRSRTNIAKFLVLYRTTLGGCKVIEVAITKLFKRCLRVVPLGT